MGTFTKGAPGVWMFKVQGTEFLAIKNEAGFAHRNWDLYTGDGQHVLSDQLATRQECYAEADKIARREAALKRWVTANPQPWADIPNEGQEFVVDVYVPFAVTVNAAKGDLEMAAAMAIEDFQRSGLRERMDALVNEDFDNAFVISDSDYQTEVGEA